MKKVKAGKKSHGIYRKLVISYAVFALLMLVLFIVSLSVIGTLSIGRRGLSLSPAEVVNQDEIERQASEIAKMRGWIEALDDNFQVTEIYGEKETSRMSYTAKDLLRLTRADIGQGSIGKIYRDEYMGILNERTDAKGYYLIIYPRSDVKVQITRMFSPNNTNPLWFYLLLFMFLILFLAVCLLMGYFLSRGIRKPLSHLMQAMERVKLGEAYVELDFKAGGEFAEIKDTFNLMVYNLKKAESEKEEAENKKNKMLLDLSHDLRTPIATISSMAIALEEDMVSQEEKKRYYETIQLKADKVNLLAEDLFTMLKMKSEGYVLQRSNVDLSELLRRLCAEYYSDAELRGLELLAEIPDESIYFQCDESLLTRAAGNLVANAVKYNQTGTFVKAVLTNEEDKISILVADDGNEIPEEIRNQMFDDFARGDQARRSDGGTGLGLSIAKAIVEKHGGMLFYRRECGQNQFKLALEEKGESR